MPTSCKRRKRSCKLFFERKGNLCYLRRFSKCRVGLLMKQVHNGTQGTGETSLGIRYSKASLLLCWEEKEISTMDDTVAERKRSGGIVVPKCQKCPIWALSSLISWRRLCLRAGDLLWVFEGKKKGGGGQTTKSFFLWQLFWGRRGESWLAALGTLITSRSKKSRRLSVLFFFCECGRGISLFVSHF